MRLEPLLTALRELFGPRLGFGAVVDDGLPMQWDGVEESSAWFGNSRVWFGNSEEEDLAFRLLTAAHDAALEGLGRRGEHPGAWANASPEVLVEAPGLRLVLRLGEREVASVPVSPEQRGGRPASPRPC